jgi:capsular exopolysaccharide synthesis family protein
LERTKTNTEKLYGMVLERAKESDLSGMLRFNNISVVEPPTAPNVPFRPRIPLNLAVGFAVGVSLGLLLMFGKEQLDQTIRSPQDIDVDADVPMLGLLPMVSAHSRSPGYYSRSRRRGLMAAKAAAESATEILVHDAPSSNVAECARSIRTNLTFSSPDKPFRRILVTSGSPSEGKTTIACTIAIAFAQVGQRVLLMDCDLRRPRIHKIMKKPNSTGITTVLQNPSEVDTCIHETQIPNLSLLTAGPHVPNPAELVQSESFCKLLDTLTEKYDRIIIDSPPVLAVTDASVIATRVDTTLLVIRAAKSRRDLLRQTVRKFRELGLPLAGMVMNALDSKQSGYYHYYPYYGYGRKYDTTSADGA